MTMQHVAYLCLVWGLLFIAAVAAQHLVYRRFTADLSRAHKTELANAIQSVHQSYVTQDAAIAEELKLLREQNNEVNEIALFLRNNYKQEMQLGAHANRTFSQIIIGYLAKERECQKKQG